MVLKAAEKSEWWAERNAEETTLYSALLLSTRNSKLSSWFVEISIRPNESISFLPTIPSMDVDESVDAAHRPLAPLASSETFTDVVGISHSERQHDDQPVTSPEPESPSPAHQQPNRTKTTKSEFDSLEILFDFPSSGISTETQLDESRISQSSNRIRFLEDERVLNTTIASKVVNQRASWHCSDARVFSSFFRKNARFYALRKLIVPPIQHVPDLIRVELQTQDKANRIKQLHRTSFGSVSKRHCPTSLRSSSF